jgi:hypothetical protein
MEYYTFDYETKLYTGAIDIPDPVKQYDPRIPGNAVKVEPPAIEESQAAKWNGEGWTVVDIPDEIVPEPSRPTREEQIDLVIRPTRDMKLRAYLDRIDRYNNQIVEGVSTTDSDETMLKIRSIMQLLRDFPSTVIDPFNPIWPDEGIII